MRPTRVGHRFGRKRSDNREWKKSREFPAEPRRFRDSRIFHGLFQKIHFSLENGVIHVLFYAVNSNQIFKNMFDVCRILTVPSKKVIRFAEISLYRLQRKNQD